MDLISEGSCAKETDEVSGFLSNVMASSQRGKKLSVHHLNIAMLLNTVCPSPNWRCSTPLKYLLPNLQTFIYWMAFFPQLMIFDLFQRSQKYHFTL